ncbi:unnamed protein product [Ectocarpus sp. 13 AM-2016]
MSLLLQEDAARYIDSETTNVSAGMKASATWVPASWGGQQQGAAAAAAAARDGDELFFGGGGGSSGSASDEKQQQYGSSSRGGELRRVDSTVIDDSDEEMEPFDAERFVDRLVEDPAPTAWGRGGLVGGGGRVWEAAASSSSSGSSHSGGAAKLFQHVFNFDEHQPYLVGDGGGYDGTDNHYHRPQQQRQQQQQQSQDMPMIVPHDPILDAIFTPCRAVLPSTHHYHHPADAAPAAVTCGLVRVPSGGRFGAGKKKNEIAAFRPELLYNIPPPPPPEVSYAAPLQVPMAPLRQPSVGRGLFSSSPRGRVMIQSAERSPAAAAARHVAAATYSKEENSNNIPVEFSPSGGGAMNTAATTTPLTGADAHFSREYDDERYAFLRRQEAALAAGARYITGGVILEPAAWSAAVDWLSRLHAAAPAASGGSEPLSLETLFLAVNLMDRFLATPQGAKTVWGDGGGGVLLLGPAVKLAGAACLALASKYQDTQAASLWGVAAASISSSTSSSQPPLRLGGGADSGGGVGGGGGDFFGVLGAGDSLSLGGGGGSGSGGGGGNADVRAARKELAATEMQVASALGFRLTVPTSMSFLGVFLRRAEGLGYVLADGPGRERVRREAEQILLCMLRESCSLEHPPSALAASALYWASCVTTPGAAPPTSFAFLAVTGYELEQLCCCLRDMEAVRTGGGRRYDGAGSFASCSSPAAAGAGGEGGGGGSGDWAGAALPEHAGNSLFGAGGGHPAIAAL